MRGTQQSLARRVTLLYVLLGGAWIIFSDQLLAFLVRHPPQMATLQTVKGWIFVAISATLLYSLLRYEVRKRQGVEAELYRVNRALRTLSECNQILIRTTEEPELLQRICQGIVTVGGYRMAWVGYLEHDPARRIRPMAQAGVAAGYLETAPISWADTERGREPAGQAIRTGQPCVRRNSITDASLGPWRAAAAQRGYAAAIALPLINAGQTLGVLNIYADEPEAFDGEAVRLMTELANDLAFGVSNLRLRSAHQQAEEALTWEAEVNAAMATLSHQLIALVAPEQIATLVLEQAKRLTGSTFGYVGYIDQQTGFLVCPTMTRDIWEVCQVMNKGIVFEQFGGLWGWVLDHRQPLLTNEPATDPRSGGTPIGHVPIERFLSVPAMMGPTLLGQIALANAPRDYTDRDLAVIQRMASIYAMAIQRKQDEDAIRQYAGRLQHIHAIDRAILSAHSPADIAQATLSHLYKLVPYQHACVALFDSEIDTARILANYAYDTFQPAMQESIPLRAFRSLVDLWEGQTYVKTTVESDDWQPPCCQVALSKRLHSFLTVPLIVQQNTIGALTLGATTPDAFSAESIELVQEVVNQLAIAIQQARLFEQVHDGRERLQTLSRRLVEIQEIERRHIARELHDEIGQTLTGLHLLLEMNSRVVGTQSQNLQNAQLLVNELMRRVREISLDLRPAMLDDLGLLPTLRWHFNRYTTQTGIEVLFKHHGVERRFASDIETAIYRLVQEALTNIARHAQVDILTVRLWADEEVLEVQIEDTGIGFDQDRVLAGKTSNGLTGMRERVELLGGTFAIRSQPGQGTCLTVTMPLEHVVVAV
ncbi:MAG: GAF domain-containing protein [Chloroflexaceae bacterium]